MHGERAGRRALERSAALHSGKPRDDVLATQREEGAAELQPFAVGTAFDLAPHQAGALECRAVIRVGNGGAHRGVGEARKAPELFASPARHGGGEIGPEIAEIEKRRAGQKLLPHEEERHRRREQHARRCRGERLLPGERADPLAEGAVADLVVGLEEVHECGRRQVGARLPACAAAIRRALALKGEAFGERAAKPPHGPVRVVRVVPVALASDEHVQGVVRVVVPLRAGEERRLPRVANEVARFVPIVLEHEMNMALASRPVAHRARDRCDDVRIGLVRNRVHRVKA